MELYRQVVFPPTALFGLYPEARHVQWHTESSSSVHPHYMHWQSAHTHMYCVYTVTISLLFLGNQALPSQQDKKRRTLCTCLKLYTWIHTSKEIELFTFLIQAIFGMVHLCLAKIAKNREKNSFLWISTGCPFIISRKYFDNSVPSFTLDILWI